MTFLTVVACALALVLPATSAAAETAAAPSGASTVVNAPQPSPTVWLCRPDRADNPCKLRPAATVLAPDGTKIGTEHPRVPANPPIDCFFIYPTVSDQQTVNSNLDIDPQERAIAEIEGSRFSRVCRVFAPMYRQITLFAIDHPELITPEAHKIADDDIRAAWTDYLEHYNHGRGVVLIGHSQGGKQVRQVIQNEIEPQAASLGRLVSALVIGANVIVPKGQDVGGDFKKVPACRSTTQTGCVVAYSTYNQTPPPDARFGIAQHANRQVLCTNPAALGGGSGPLRTYLRAAPFPGSLEQQFKTQLGPLPSVPTPWISEPHDYSGVCTDSGGVSRLQLTADSAAPVLTPTPDPTWGLHLSDIPLALGNLTTLVGEQGAAFSGSSSVTCRSTGTPVHRTDSLGDTCDASAQDASTAVATASHTNSHASTATATASNGSSASATASDGSQASAQSTGGRSAQARATDDSVAGADATNASHATATAHNTSSARASAMDSSHAFATARDNSTATASASAGTTAVATATNGQTVSVTKP